MTRDQGSPGGPQGSPGTPGREAEDVPVDGGSPSPSPDDDRNLTLSEEGEGPADPSKVNADAQDPGAASAAGDELEQDIAGLLSETERERDEYLELAQRTKADFENYRRRMAAEVQAASVRGKAELVSGLIGVIDNLERALEAAGIKPGAEADSDDSLSQGILLTYRELCSTLERAGIESFDPAGERFDPNRHEALQQIPIEGTEAGTVVETTQRGYRLGEQLIRPARVVVSS
jgi:molecular chaperone GrpE